MEYISLRNATNLCSYSQEYLSLRARQGKLKAVKIRRAWSTTKEWLQDYLARIEGYNKKVEPPSKLPIYAPDADRWEDEVPEEVAQQENFQRKLQFAFATVCVVALLGIALVRSEGAVMHVADFSGSAVLSSALSLQATVENAGFGVGEIVQEYFGWLSNQIRSIAQIFRSDTKLVVPSNPVVPRLDLARQAAPAGRGLVVLPSSEDNAVMKEQIRQSFSDEVMVTPYDEESGIITPVFRYRTGEDYLYILVPLRERD